VHGPGTDDPLIGYRNGISPNQFDYLYYATDGQGRQFAVGDTIGNNAQTDAGYRGGGKFAGGTRYGTSFFASRYSNQNTPGLSFFRNRLYDQASGRWTQEDPIGVAGGVNLYQFNGNNPVAYTDPFGLCPTCIKVALLMMSTPDAVSNNRISQLDARLQPLANFAVNMLYAQGQPVRVVQGVRTFAEQDALFEIGRRGIVGERKVTNARGGESPHNFGEAVDVYPLEGGKVGIPPVSDSRWQAIGNSGKAVGLKWGGDFKTLKDYPHWELPNWRDN